MEEFRTSIFEKTKAKTRRRMVSTLIFIGTLAVIWALCLFGYLGLKISLSIKGAVYISAAVVAAKLYDDKASGVSAYGERKANLTITDQYLEIRETKIPYSEMSNLVIYVDEYLGKQKEFFGIHHGGNNKIEFGHRGKLVAINYVIKNKADFDRVNRLVNKIENDPNLKENLQRLN